MDPAAAVVSGVEHTAKGLLLIPLFPLIGSAIVYFLTNREKKTHGLSGWVATIAAVSSFVLAVKLFFQLGTGVDAIVAHAWTWFTVDRLNVEFAFRFDHLAAVMTLIITGVGSLIHLYAIGYMAEDDNRPRFFCYLNLFLFAMLLLVLGDNLLVMFVGWEGVGLCSYLLIGFWFKEMDNANAGQKAFVVNRIGDAGFLIGIFSLFILTGSLNFQEMANSIGVASPLLEFIALMLFIGAVGKSAQVPLYVWLPDAMAGPTPVSALIHAATMVTAGVYMIARMSFLYELAPFALTVITVVGTFTALIAATIALVQNDIKKVLAYSTVSQLGYMFMAMGAGAYSNGIYHVVTHAFFKACLFMCAGSVIIGCHHVQDMREYGGLRKKMPWTFITYFVATLAIAGFPYLSGFYSKDAILWTVFSNPNPYAQAIVFGDIPLRQLCWAFGLFTAFLTAFYMTRSLMMTFFGEYRGHEHPHESPWVVTVPLVILAILSAGFAAIYGEAFIHYLEAWTRSDMVDHDKLLANDLYHSLEMISIGVALGGIAIGVLFYTALSEMPKRLSRTFAQVHTALSNKWWVDELYHATIVRPLAVISGFLFRVVDRILIDGTVNGTGMFVEANGEAMRWMHSGRLSSYALFMFLGSMFLTMFYLLFRFF